MWVDSKIDINLKSQRTFNVLELQTGMSLKSQMQFQQDEQFLLKQLRCQDLSKDLIFVGPCQDADGQESVEHVISKGGMVFGGDHCVADNVDKMLELVRKQSAYQAIRSHETSAIPRSFWISCNMNALDSMEFRSKTRRSLVSGGNDGVTLDFLTEFIRKFTRHSIGMDLSDVNFVGTKETSQRHADEQTFRELFEIILESVNGSEHRDFKTYHLDKPQKEKII